MRTTITVILTLTDTDPHEVREVELSRFTMRESADLKAFTGLSDAEFLAGLDEGDATAVGFCWWLAGARAARATGAPVPAWMDVFDTLNVWALTADVRIEEPPAPVSGPADPTTSEPNEPETS